jgi:hypothetical protein
MGHSDGADVKYCHAKRFLLSAFGGKGKEIPLALFTVFVDDSGTDPSQKIAVAGCLIVPAVQIAALQKDWNLFKASYGIRDYFHSSECAAHKPGQKSEFADWSNDKAVRAFRSARAIIKRRAVKAFSFSVHKADFDSEATNIWRKSGGQNHYTWAFRSVLHQLIRWHKERGIGNPFEFIFDYATGSAKQEIEMLMDQFEDEYPGRFRGRFDFKLKTDVPALQCADIVAWSCYNVAHLAFLQKPVPPIAYECFMDFSTYRDGKWLDALTFTRQALREVVAIDTADPNNNALREQWYERWVDKRKATNEPKKSK